MLGLGDGVGQGVVLEGGRRASDVAAALLAATLEGAHTVAGGLRLLLAVALGRRAVSGTTHTYRNLANDKNRVVATVDSSGNRSTATADGT